MTTTLSTRRKALLAAWAVLSAAIVFVVVGVATEWLFAASIVFILVSMAMTGYLIATWGSDKVARERAFLDTYGSLDGARAALDLDALRAVRDTDGVIPAVRQVRHQHPAIPLAQAAEIVKSL